MPGYEIRGVLGRGGMGVVYRALQVSLKREVALKMIRAASQDGPEQLARFQAEAEIVARLRHPNVVQIHEIGTHKGQPFLALEYVDGGSLAERLRDASLPAAVAAELVETLARAMHSAHQRGIVHRDLKPANILVRSVATEATESTEKKPIACSVCSVSSVAKITDFGLVKQLDAEAGHTQSGAIMGTPSYMAPEQAAGKVKEIGPATDVYALGAVLYEALTGRPPFRGQSTLDTLEQVRSQEPVAPRHLQPKVPRDLETICLKCLRKEPRQRYATAVALADDLRRFREGRPIRARPVGKVERLGKWARRNPVLAVLTGVLVITVLGLVGISGYLFWTLQVLREQQQLVTEKSQLAERQSELATGNLFAALDAFDELTPQMHPESQKMPDPAFFRRVFLNAADGLYGKLLANQGSPGLKNQRGVGRAFYGKGMILFMRGKLEAAREQFERALAVQETLVADGSGEPGCLYELGLTFSGLGDLLNAMSRPDEAVAAYQKAASNFVKLLTEDPHALNAAAAFVHKISTTGKIKETIAFLDQFIGQLETLLQKEQRPGRRKRFEAVAQELLVVRAISNMQTGQFAEAQRDWDRRAKEDSSSSADLYQALRAQNLAQLGKHEESAAALEALLHARKGNISATAHVAAVRAYAHAIRAAQGDRQMAAERRDKLVGEYATHAVALLRKLQATGYFQDRSQLEELRTYDDLQPLHTFPAFQQWLREMEGKELNGDQRPPRK